MTFAVGRKLPASKPAAYGREDGATAPAAGRAAFTLLEIVLTLALLAALLAVAVANLTGMARSQKLEEGARRMESLLTMARIEAAARGRRLRLEFDELQAAKFTIEVDPLGQPGVFEAFGGEWIMGMPTDLIRVAGCRAAGVSAWRNLNDEPSRDGQEQAFAITFYADGTCDSAILDLASLDPRDARRISLELDGLSGAVQRTVYTPVE